MSLTGKDALKRPMNIHKTPVKGYGKRLCHYNESIDENVSISVNIVLFCLVVTCANESQFGFGILRHELI